MAHTVADILVTPMNDSLIDFDLLAKIEASTGKVVGLRFIQKWFGNADK